MSRGFLQAEGCWFESAPGHRSHWPWQGSAAPTPVSTEQQFPCCSLPAISTTRASCNRCWIQAVMLNSQHPTCPPGSCLILFKPTYSFDLSKIRGEGVPQYKYVADTRLHFHCVLFSAWNWEAGGCPAVTGRHTVLLKVWSKKPQIGALP